MYLYQTRLIKLEKEYENAKQSIRNLQKNLEDSEAVPEETSETLDNKKAGGSVADAVPQPLDIPRIKIKVDLVISSIKIVKEQTAFYLKLCEDYDVVKLLEELVDELSDCDCGTCRKTLVKICRSWGFEPSQTF